MAPTSPILTGIGLLEGGKLTKTAKDKYIDEVIGLLITGNANGTGGSPSTKIFNSLMPLPPISGPDIANVTTLKVEKLFWFEPDPVATIMATQLRDPKNNPTWHKIFPELLFEKIANALDTPGSTPFAATFVFDPTSVSLPKPPKFPPDPPIPFPPPMPKLMELFDINVALPTAIPQLTVKLADLLIVPDLPKIPIPPIPPTLPPIPPPPGVAIPVLELPKLILPDLLIGLIKLPFDLLTKLLLPPDVSIVVPPDPISLLTKILKMAIDIVFDLLKSLGMLLTTPKLFIASLLIWIKDIVAMIGTIVVAKLLGTGELAKTVATIAGLI